MCVIIHLKPGQQIPKPMLNMAIQNNPHGYGLIFPENNQLTTIRNAADNEYDVIEEQLQKNGDVDRYLHLRWKTHGLQNIDNCHPFSVVKTRKNDVLMMHNGILQGYTTNEDAKDQSDTKNFVDAVVTPVLSRLKFPQGFINLQDPLVFTLLDSLTPHNNRLLLINKDNQPLFLGNWVKFTYNQGQEKSDFVVSNATYFRNYSRGRNTYFQGGHHRHTPALPLHGQAHRQGGGHVVGKKLGEKKDGAASYKATRTGVQNVGFTDNLVETDNLLNAEQLHTLITTKDNKITAEVLAQLAYLVEWEVIQFLKDDKNHAAVADLIIYMASELEELQNDKEKAEKVIARYVNANDSKIPSDASAGTEKFSEGV